MMNLWFVCCGSLDVVIELIMLVLVMVSGNELLCDVYLVIGSLCLFVSVVLVCCMCRLIVYEL